MNYLVVLFFLFFVYETEVVGQGRLNVTRAVHQIEASSQLITRHIQDFHNYLFDGRFSSSITDGGFDMYDGGNKIVLRYNGFPTAVKYGTLYKKTPLDFFSDKIHPFTALWWIDSSVNSKYSIEVISNFGADGRGYVMRYNGSVNFESYTFRYKVFSLYGAQSDASVCEVYFVVENQKEWGSTSPKFTYMETAFDPRLETKNRAILSGSFYSVLFGYTLYSKFSGAIVTEAEVRAALNETVAIVVLKAQDQNESTTQQLHSSPSTSTTSTVNNIASSADRDLVSSAKASSSSPVAASTAAHMMTEDVQASRPESITQEPHISSFFSKTSTENNVIRSPDNDIVTSAVKTTPSLVVASTAAQTVTETFQNGRFETFVERQRDFFHLTTSVAQFHFYRYDSTSNNAINDGGSDMYDTGNMVYYYVNGQGQQVLYNRTYNGSTFKFTSLATYPFVAFFDIESDSAWPNNYTIRVQSNLGADGSGTFSRFSDSTSFGNYTIEYKVAQVFDGGDPTVCEVYFLVSLDQQRTGDTSFTLDTPINDRHAMDNTAVLHGTITNAVFGYALLSRSTEEQISTIEIRSVMHSMLLLILGEDITERPSSTSYFTKILSRRLRNLNQVTNQVSNFYFYRYDQGGRAQNQIGDGGNDMYDNGNKVYIKVDNDSSWQRIIYNRTYRRSNYTFTSIVGHPFLAFFYTSPKRSHPSYSFKVVSNLGADGRGVFQRFAGNVRAGNYTINYSGAQVFGAGDPSVCEIFFVVCLDQGSATSLLNVTSVGQGTNTMDNRAHISGDISNVVFGYTLLSKARGEKVNEEEMKRAMRNLLHLIIGSNNETSDVTDPVLSTAAPTTTSNVHDVIRTTGIPISPTGTIAWEDATSEQAKDLDFLPSCTVAQTIRAVFRCEKIFAESVNYIGPQTCRDILQRVFRCAAIQLYQCQQGAKESKLDTFNLPEFNLMETLSVLNKLGRSGESNEYRQLNTFCHHAGLGLKYPHEIERFYELCNKTFWNDLLMQVTKFFYHYTWAKDTADTCKAFRKFQSWLVEAARTHCSIDYVNSTFNEEARMYFKDFLKTAVDTVEELKSITCAETDGNIFFDDFDCLLFGGRFKEQNEIVQTSS